MSANKISFLAIVGACMIWGLSPLYYKLLTHVPPQEILAHRALWSLIFFAALLAVQGRLHEIAAVLRSRRQVVQVALATSMVSVNWFLFIYATQVDQVRETSLGYFILPLVVILIGRLGFGEPLDRLQWSAVALATVAVVVLTIGLGVAPWISLILAATFGYYSAIKKNLPVGPVVSVTCEVLLFLPLGLVLFWFSWRDGGGVFATDLGDSLLLMASGLITALPLILFSVAARQLPLSTLGILQYINPTLQFLLAIVVFGEPLTVWHSAAFSLIWIALALYTVALLRQDRAARRVIIAEAGVSASKIKSRRDESAKP